MTDTVTIPADVARSLADELRIHARQCPPAGSMAASLRAAADLLDPKPPTLREQVVDTLHHLNGNNRDDWYEDADSILGVVAEAVENITGPSVGDIVRSADVVYRADVLRLLGAGR